jgi:surface antigen Omp85-like protein
MDTALEAKGRIGNGTSTLDQRAAALAKGPHARGREERLCCAMASLQHSLIMVLALASARPLVAQNPSPGVDLPTDGHAPISTTTHGLLAIPVVVSGPTIGTGFGGVAAYLFRLDSSRSSSIGVGGIYSTTQSWLFAFAGRVPFNGSRRVALGGIEFFDVNYDFFGVGTAAGRADQSIPIAQNGDAEMVEFLGRLPGRVYLGPRYFHRGLTTALKADNANNPLTPLARTNNNYNVSALGFGGEFDTRDNQDMPHHGSLSDLSVMWSEDFFGSDQNFAFYRFYFNQYVALTSQQVLALRVSTCGVGSAAPIWEYCLYGTHSDLRGYQAGRYRDQAMFALQGELRSPIVDRLGGALFGGIGSIGSSFGNAFNQLMLPSGGLGLRYLASETYHVNIGVDYAWSRDGGAFYLRFGEAY